MDEDRSISKAVRHLEDLRSAGYITPEQFMDEVRDLLAGLGMDQAEAERTAAAVMREAPSDPEPETLPVHEPEGVFAGGFALEDPEPPPEPDPPLPDEEPRLQQPSVPPGARPRVVIKGSVPWEREEQSTRMGVVRVKDDKSAPEESDDKDLHHRQLAKLAIRDITRLQRKRNPRTVALASLLVPGLGHFMLDRPGPGAGFALVWAIGMAFVLGFGEWDALYVLVPTTLLASALAHKHAMLHNYHLERRRLLAQRRTEAREASLNLDRSVREGEWERMGLDSPKR